MQASLLKRQSIRLIAICIAASLPTPLLLLLSKTIPEIPLWALLLQQSLLAQLAFLEAILVVEVGVFRGAYLYPANV